MVVDKPKILLGAPINKVKEYCLFDWLRHIKKLTYSMDVLLVDNTRGDKFRDSIVKYFDGKILYVNPKGKRNVDYMCECQNLLRDYFLNGDYDYFFSLECDLFPPLDVVETLLSHDKEVVSLSYFINEGEQSQLCLSDIENSFCSSLVAPVKFDDCYNRYNGQLIKVDACGVGCTLIKREVMELLQFRIVPNENLHADTWFYLDLRNKGIDAWLDTSTIVEHRNRSWNSITDYAKV